MSLDSGSRLGPYEILAPLGAGGMGEVYRARDPRLGREVAIKILPASFSSDPERLRRFEQEARSAGILNHPNITAVYDLGTHDGAPYVVQELLEGQTLRGVIADGRLPARKTVDYARGIAEGLAAAHDKGIVHRDLKPENLFVTREGRVKILDFGLAKLTQREEGREATDLPTATAGTEPGVVLGTLGYMSPEQVRGKPADARSDIFAFGAILYEMLSGRRAFHGDSAADTMSAILKEEPPELSLSDRTVSPGHDRIVRHCLEKNPQERFQSARDLAFNLAALSEISGSAIASLPSSSAKPAMRPRSTGFLLALAAILLTAAGVYVGRATRRPPPPPSLHALTYSGLDWSPSASPDGTTIAFASARDGKQRIWIKQLSGGSEVPLTSGPEDAHPRFSPDGASLLFERTEAGRSSLFRVASVGGEARRLVSEAGEADWSPSGSEIAFLRRRVEQGVSLFTLCIAAADGSAVRPVADFRGLYVRSPRWTPDGRAIVVVESGAGPATTSGKFHWVSRDGKERRILLPPASRGTVSSLAWSGRDMIYSQSETSTGQRSSAARILRQRPGSSSADVLFHVTNFGSNLDLLSDGRLVLDEDLTRQSLKEVALSGAAAARWVTRGNSTDRQPAYSPDGARLVFSSDRGGNFDIWEITLKTGAARRLTEDPADDWDPAISPDGKHLLWSSDRSGHFEIWIADADGTGAHQLTHDGLDAENPEETPDGRWVVYTSGNSAHLGVWRIRPDGSEAHPVITVGAVHPEISPDGAYVLYQVGGQVTRVVRLADGKVLPLSIPLHTLFGVGRSRWMPGGKAIASVGLDENSASGVFVQDFSPDAADTSATRRKLAGFDPDQPTGSFGLASDGSRVTLSNLEGRWDILLADGVSGVAPVRRSK
jgi:serine/threonine protein kinase